MGLRCLGQSLILGSHTYSHRESKILSCPSSSLCGGSQGTDIGRPQDTKWYAHNSADASNTGSVCGRSHPSRTLCAYPYLIYLPLPPTSSSSASMSVPFSCQLKQGTLQPDTHGLYIPASVYPSSSSQYPEQFLKIDSGLSLSRSGLLYSSL